MKALGLRICIVIVGGALTSLACGDHDARPSEALPLPSEETFFAVSSVLEPNCGTLDCHGDPARSLRIYGKRGLRANGSAFVGEGDTAPSDIQATFRSVVSIEPERLSGVFSTRGAGVERWVVVSKARGRERHAGGIRMPEGSPGDRCLVSWASGSIDQSACTADVFGPIARPGETW